MRNRIKIISAMLFLVGAIISYLVIHGTDNLLIVHTVNSFVNIIPVFEGTECRNIFLTGYLVDILWFISFVLITSVYIGSRHNICVILVLLIAILLEILQLVLPIYGTFDFIDILVYISISIMYILTKKLFKLKDN